MRMISIVRDIVLGVLIIVGFIVFFGIDRELAKKERTAMFESKLAHAGLNIVEFIRKGEYEFRGVEFDYGGVPRIKLPTETVSLGTPEEFILMAQEHNQDIVYRNVSALPWGGVLHYVFNQDRTMAWGFYTVRGSHFTW